MAKRILFFILGICLIVPLPALSISQEEGEVPIQVPVKVQDSGAFVDSLTSNDFLVYEDGELQKLDALYLFNGLEVVRMEDSSGLPRSQGRHFYFLMQIIDFTPEISDALFYFLENVFSPYDTLTVATHRRTYTLSSEALKIKPKTKLANEMVEIIKKDTEDLNANYNVLYNTFRRVTRSLVSASRVNLSGGGRISVTEEEAADVRTDSYDSAGIQVLLDEYTQALGRLNDLKVVDEKSLLDFASMLKAQAGRKYAFLFYEREFTPVLEDNPLTLLTNAFQNDRLVTGKIQEVIKALSLRSVPDVAGLRQACADSGAMFDFVYADNPATMVTGVRMRDKSEDFYSAFSEMAYATGGKTSTSYDPNVGFLDCLKDSQRHYLLYYTPSHPPGDGAYHAITVKLKDLPYSVTYRIGYVASVTK